MGRPTLSHPDSLPFDVDLTSIQYFRHEDILKHFAICRNTRDIPTTTSRAWMRETILGEFWFRENIVKVVRHQAENTLSQMDEILYCWDENGFLLYLQRAINIILHLKAKAPFQMAKTTPLYKTPIVNYRRITADAGGSLSTSWGCSDRC